MITRYEGKQVNLRRVTKKDAEDIARWAKDRLISRYMYIPYPYGLQDAYDFIRLDQKWWRGHSNRNFGLEHPETGKIIGMIGLMHLNARDRNGEIGYWLAKPHWGNGIMPEACRLCLKFAFQELKLKRVYAHTRLENKPSQRVLEKLGFTLEGRLRKASFQQNRYHDVFLFSMVREEFK